jgi:hypothetical protein
VISALSLTVGKPEGSFYKLILNAANIGACVFARNHISNFWLNKAKVPLAGTYNTAINSTLVIKRQLEILAGTWFITTIFAVAGFMS